MDSGYPNLRDKKMELKEDEIEVVKSDQNE